MATHQQPVVRVGVAAVIKNSEGKLLMGIRKGSSGGTWQFPGGHLEVGETPFVCAERETWEEAGIHVKAERMLGLTNDIFDPESKHYITIFVSCRLEDDGQEPMTMEPDKCEGWFWREWVDIKELVKTEQGRNKVFLPIINLLKDQPDLVI
ncbi:NUDIX hydrolase domain-like protein [Rhypophila decipiens]